MGNIIEIKDLNSHLLDPYFRLTENQLRNRKNKSDGIFIAESKTVVTLALNAGYTPLSLLIQSTQITACSEIISRCDNIPIYTASDELLEKTTGFSLSRGVLGVFKRPLLSSVADICKTAKRICILENIADSTNVGAIFRSAAALGIDAVLVTPSCSDPLLRRSVRVSMGTIFNVPWTYIVDSNTDWPKTGIEKLRSLGFKTVAMALSDKSICIDDKRLKEENKLAIIMGTEGTGLLSETINLSDYTAKIPMFHDVDSLNVAAAAAVAFWELRRTKS